MPARQMQAQRLTWIATVELPVPGVLYGLHSRLHVYHLRMSDHGSNITPRMVQCVKLGKELPGLAAPPWPGELGQRVYEQVSAQAWKLWEDRMKMILNEYRLLPFQKEAQEVIARHMEDFFFGQDAATPPNYVPEAQQ